jgi:5'-nucleotidase
VTNDDGITGEGLRLLAEALRGLSGHTVFVLAPEDDRSGVSHSFSLNGPLRLRDWGNNTCSGTAAAARQAAIYGIPGVAFSLVTLGEGPVFWESAAAFSRDHLEELVALWEKDTFINVNIPNSLDYPGELRMTVPSRCYYRDAVAGFDAPDGSRYCFIHRGPVVTDEDPGSDWGAISRNQVAISVVHINPMVRS